jgi:bd-type cytochrome oxidase subunit I
VAAVESGWVVSEMGRQPWTVYHVLTAGQAATTAGGVPATLAATLVIYGALTVGTFGILGVVKRRWDREAAATDGTGSRGAPGPRAPGPRAPGPRGLRGPGWRRLRGLTRWPRSRRVAGHDRRYRGGRPPGGEHGVCRAGRSRLRRRDLLAVSATGGAAARSRIDESITPVWESDHVWLIVAVVGVFLACHGFRM